MQELEGIEVRFGRQHGSMLLNTGFVYMCERMMCILVSDPLERAWDRRECRHVIYIIMVVFRHSFATAGFVQNTWSLRHLRHPRM